MQKIAKLLPTILSVLMVSTSLSVSACDLSCLLNQTSPDASLAAEDGLTVPSAMEIALEWRWNRTLCKARSPSTEKRLALRLTSCLRRWRCQVANRNNELDCSY